MDEIILKKINLENKLSVTIYDSSKKLIGDRYQVILVAKMEVPVAKSLVENQSQISVEIQAVTCLLGETIIFEQKREKIFVDEKEKENLLKSMVDSFVTDIIPYLSRPDFPIRYIEKQYKDKSIKLSRQNPD